MLIKETLLSRIPQPAIRSDLPLLFHGDTKLAEIFTFEALKNFKALFLETLFFKSSLQNAIRTGYPPEALVIDKSSSGHKRYHNRFEIHFLEHGRKFLSFLLPLLRI